MSQASEAADTASRTGECCSTYVLPDRQGEGTGHLLLDRSCAAMREAGFTEAVLWVLAGNAPAIAFYECMGWRDDGRTRQEPIAGMTIQERRYRHLLV